VCMMILRMELSQKKKHGISKEPETGITNE
jgi:hypothetical protein